MIHSNQGSIWRRWDIHIHTPGTLHSDGFQGDWNAYLSKIEKALPTVSALGITDYFTLDSYKEAVNRQQQGKIPNVWLFPNVELRLDIAGKNWINFHFLFSPEDPNHINIIERELMKLEFKVENKQIYRCSNSSLRELGRHHDPSQTDERGALKVGAMQFKASLDNIEKILEIPWVKKNAITAVSSANNDGTAALQGSSAAMRKRIESLADIIFSGSEKTRLFWLSPNNGLPPKPTIFSCDAHCNDKVLKPRNEKNCWFKGDLCFDTLKQILLEPERRVYLGKDSEPDPPPYAVINKIEVENSPWFTNGTIPLNSGLVTIIGARGSGKTALADLIAMGAGVYDHSNRDSFIFRAQNTFPT
jgi:hypothetical protein